MELSCFVFIWQKRLHQCYVTVHLSLSVFVGFSFDKSFNIFVGEGHESFTCRIFGCFFWCTARGHRNLLVVISFLNKPSEQRSRTTRICFWNYEIMASRCQKWRERRRVTSRKLIGRIFTCKIIVILHVPITIFLSGGNLYKTLQFI